MRLISLFVAAALVSSPVLAQQAQRSSNPQGVQIQGNTNISAENKNVTAVAVGQGNEAKNTTGAIKGGTQIQGNTNIKAQQTNATAVAVGKNNTAANEAGVIGGK
jgi:PBP1b-binding outer membrane lipoprotein LpoB